MVIIKGQPQGKERPRFRNVGKFVQTYTPKKTKDYEKHIKQSYLEQNGVYWGELPIKVEIKAFYQIHMSWSKKRQNMAIFGGIRPTTKPDTDNIAKAVCDALNGVAFADDKQVVELSISKWYDIEPRIELNIFEISCENS